MLLFPPGWQNEFFLLQVLSSTEIETSKHEYLLTASHNKTEATKELYGKLEQAMSEENEIFGHLSLSWSNTFKSNGVVAFFQVFLLFPVSKLTVFAGCSYAFPMVFHPSDWGLHCLRTPTWSHA